MRSLYTFSNLFTLTLKAPSQLGGRFQFTEKLLLDCSEISR
ncbi:hypothetical protein FDUTEX481_03957 [Tolypothrix sp. PCC 7601]|nr:hypothetical protein FDUTEX481_03957 [Tolypothrix sp. PCC 7601]